MNSPKRWFLFYHFNHMKKNLIQNFRLFLLSTLITVFGFVSVARGDLFTQYEDLMYFEGTTVLLSIGWGLTTHELLTNPNEYDPIYHDLHPRNRYVDHLHIGFGLHMLGTVLKHNFPKFYHQELRLGARLLMASGWIIQVDDIYQHLYWQKRDGFNLDEGKTGEIYKSPLHRYYHWCTQENRIDDWKVMLNLVEIGPFLISTGFYQGPACEFSYDFLKIERPFVSLGADCMIVIDYDVETQFQCEQMLMGISLGVRFNRWIEFELGNGYRLYNINPLLKTGNVIYYGLKIG